MGANSKMYQGAWLSLNQSTFIEWPPHKGETSLSELARRVINQFGIQHKDVLIGSSMGGMIALEISTMIDIDKVVLVGSAINVSEVNSLLTALAPLTDYAPIRFMQKLAGKQDNLIQQMFAASEAVFMKTMCKAIANWDGYPGDLTKVIRIHGEKDKIIKCPSDGYVIKRGGHLIAITHSRQCVDIINQLIR